MANESEVNTRRTAMASRIPQCRSVTSPQLTRVSDIRGKFERERTFTIEAEPKEKRKEEKNSRDRTQS